MVKRKESDNPFIFSLNFGDVALMCTGSKNRVTKFVSKENIRQYIDVDVQIVKSESHSERAPRFWESTKGSIQKISVIF